MKELSIEFADGRYLLAASEEEMALGQRAHEPIGSISWHSLYGDDIPKAVTDYYAGARPPTADRKGLRARLLALHGLLEMC